MVCSQEWAGTRLSAQHARIVKCYRRGVMVAGWSSRIIDSKPCEAALHSLHDAMLETAPAVLYDAALSPTAKKRSRDCGLFGQPYTRSVSVETTPRYLTRRKGRWPAKKQ